MGLAICQVRDSYRGILTATWENMTLRVVFSDESGVGSKKDEPITVVTAIAINFDDHWEPITSRIAPVIDEARKKHKGLLDKGQTLKGSLLYSGVRRGIEAADAILRDVLTVINQEKVLVFHGAVDRREFDDFRAIARADLHEKKMSSFDKAFEACFGEVDRTIRSFTKEQILWIADRSDRSREATTKLTLLFHRLREASLGEGGLILGHTSGPKIAGKSRIADTIYFGVSAESVALQMADVCCSTVTRYLLEKEYGWDRIVERYYKILEPALRTRGTPILFPRREKMTTAPTSASTVTR